VTLTIENEGPKKETKKKGWWHFRR
jgi:hypothetical protein